MDAITESPGLYWPVSRKYDKVDGKYRFFKAPNAKRMQIYYPLIQLSQSLYYFNTPKPQISTRSEMEIDELMTDSNVEKETHTTINDLPNDVILTIFAYFHPIDLVHRFSLVSRRWYYLATHPDFFTEVRVLISLISLMHGSVKTFFRRTSRHLRKLCIACSIPLPSPQVNSLFDICCPNVTHLDIGTFKEMNTVLLKKLSDCFPNVETLHMEEIERSTIDDDNEDEWEKTLEMLFENEDIFPKVRNFFLCDVTEYKKLPAWKRPLNVLHIYHGSLFVDFTNIRTSSWQSTLTELHLEHYIGTHDIEYIGNLHNLKVFSWAMGLFCLDEQFAHIKKLYNLEELRVIFDAEDCNISAEGLIDLFTLPEKEPEKSFPYKLKHLIFANYSRDKIDVLKAIDRNCPNLKSLGIPSNSTSAFSDGVIEFITSHFKRLVFLDISNIKIRSKDEVWDNLNDDELPDLRLLKIHGSEVNIENLKRLNLKRPKLLISSKRNYFINWTVTEDGYVFHDTFNGDITAVVNDLRQIDGLSDFAVDICYNIGLNN